MDGNMFYTEGRRDIPVVGKYDAIVAGAGPSGIAAAVSAARRGVKVLLIEYAGSVGGISTTGLMSHWTGSANSKLYHEFCQKARMAAK